MVSSTSSGTRVETAAGADSPEVLIVGKAGVGKSTFGNYLLYNHPRPSGEGFAVGSRRGSMTGGCSSITVTCTPPPPGHEKSPGGSLTVVDTPGLPNVDGRTMAFYDEIVDKARSTKKLNALVFLTVATTDREHIARDLNTLHVLLSQFAGIPCAKILACRWRMPPDLGEEDAADEEACIEAWLEGALTRAQVDVTKVVLLREGPTMSHQIFDLREFLCSLPGVHVDAHCLPTHRELRAHVQSLSDLYTRIAKHEARLDSLYQERQALNDAMSGLAFSRRKRAPLIGHLASTVAVGAPTVTVGALSGYLLAESALVWALPTAIATGGLAFAVVGGAGGLGLIAKGPLLPVYRSTKRRVENGVKEHLDKSIEKKEHKKLAIEKKVDSMLGEKESLSLEVATLQRLQEKLKELEDLERGR